MDIGRQICELHDKIDRMEYDLKNLKSWRKVFFFWPFSLIVDNHIELLETQIRAEKERMEHLFKFQKESTGLEAKAFIRNLDLLREINKRR